jgi:soluble lytic murein transglycosylase-like protein
MRTRTLRGLVLMITAGALIGLTAREAAADDPVLARLGRIARGQWTAAPPRPAAWPLPYALEIRDAARRHHVSPALLAALVRAESGFDRFAVSSKGAMGLGQLMPRTARELGVAQVFDVEENLDGSARYLSVQLRRFGDVRLALAAYHAGPQRASRGLDRLPLSTRSYIRRVLRFEREYRRAGLS